MQERLNEKSQGSEEVEALKRMMEEEKKRVDEEMKKKEEEVEELKKKMSEAKKAMEEEMKKKEEETALNAMVAIDRSLDG